MTNTIYNTFYKTTNLINNKIYYGVHSTNNLNDEYLGSGVILKIAIKKYGVNSFKKEVLKTFNTSEEAYKYEKLFITEDIINNKLIYNVSLGGRGGFVKHSEETKKKMRGRVVSLKTRKLLSSINKGKIILKEIREKMSKSKLEISPSQKTRNAIRKSLTGKKRPYELCKKLSDVQKGKRLGKENPFWKGYWITPWGIFESLSEANEQCPLVIDRGTLLNYCKKYQDKKITKLIISRSRFISDNMLNKTFKEVGFGFNPI